jgi:hypothetical protein
VWRNRLEPERKRLEHRSRARKRAAKSTDSPQLRVELMRSHEWAFERARAIAMTPSDRIGTCRKRYRKTKCACGEREILVGCDNPMLCSWCRHRHWRKWRHRITRSMDTHLRAARGAWNRGRRGMLPGVYLVTLTAPHSGDLVTDRRVMGEAWRALSKVATKRGWWSAYAATWEVTPGSRGEGHLHLHLACIASWIPYQELHEAWRVAMPGARVLNVQAPKRGKNQAGRAANYLAKYVTKGIEPTEFSGAKAGEMLVAFRNKRKVTTSRHFWIPRPRTCKTCGCQHRTIQAPCSLQDIAPGAVIRAASARSLWRIVVGSPQIELRWRDGPD